MALWSLHLLTEVRIMWSVKCVQKSQMMLRVIGSDSHVIKGRVQPLLPCSISSPWVSQFFEVMLLFYFILYFSEPWWFLPAGTTEESPCVNFWCKKSRCFVIYVGCECLASNCTVSLQHKCYILATVDRDLKRRIRKIPGVPIMYISNHR